MKISLIAVVYNEAHRLEAALQQFMGYVTDMVVYNTESTDGTERLARQFTSKVFNVPYIATPDPYFESAMLKADNDWCIICCPDEEWPAEILNRLGDWIVDFEATDDSVVGLAFQRSENEEPPKGFHLRVLNKKRLVFYPDIGDFEFEMEYGDRIKHISKHFTHRRSEEEIRFDSEFRVSSMSYIIEKYKYTKMEPFAGRIRGYKKATI